jgi:hypothetical protein
MAAMMAPELQSAAQRDAVRHDGVECHPEHPEHAACEQHEHRDRQHLGR